jgi:hypothetical protein
LECGVSYAAFGFFSKTKESGVGNPAVQKQRVFGVRRFLRRFVISGKEKKAA